MNQNDLAVLILAAGTSSRLGESKQLLEYQGLTLLEDTVKKALTFTSNVYVVLGHEKQKCEEKLKNYKVNILFNEDYSLGMGSSISFGIKALEEFENTLIMLCDQPFIPLSHFENLVKNKNKEKIVTSLNFENSRKSVPSIFPKKYYKQLEKLNEDFGARYLLQTQETIDIKLEKRYFVDIDTIEDVRKFLN
jgi:molybdenum cofactor cytidylyltransferase